MKFLLLGAALLHPSDEPGELLQWQCHNDSAVNLFVGIFITVVTITTLNVSACDISPGHLHGFGLYGIIQGPCSRIQMGLLCHRG